MEKGLLSHKGRGRGNGVKEKQSTTGDPTKVTICDEEVANLMPVVVPEHDSAINPGSNTLENNEEVAGHDTNGLSEGTFHLTKAFVVLINVTDSSIDPNKSRPTSYAKLVTGERSRKSVKFHTLLAPAGKGANVAISLCCANQNHFIREALVDQNKLDVSLFSSTSLKSKANILESVRAISKRFANNVMLSLWENWRRTSCAWHPDVDLLKEDVGNVSICGKLHSGPMAAFSEYGLSAIGTKLGTPLMLDSYTSDMCVRAARYLVTFWTSALRNSSRMCTSGKKKQTEVSSKEVSNSNPFDALNSIKNDDDLGTNGENSKAVRKGSLNAAPGLQVLSKIVLSEGAFVFALMVYRQLVGAICIAPIALYLERGKIKNLAWSGMGAVDSRSSHASQEQKDAGGRVLFNVVACVDFSQQDDFLL
nr:WAT1-related protein [Tanacetum cinerariifolium]